MGMYDSGDHEDEESGLDSKTTRMTQKKKKKERKAAAAAAVTQKVA